MKRGFRLPEKTAKLVFEGDYEGAEIVVRLRPVPLDRYLELQRLMSDNDGPGALQAFAPLIVSWNLEDEAGAIPVAEHGRADPHILGVALQQWLVAVTEPPPPLPERSGDTPT